VTSGYADLIDLELFFDSAVVSDLISLAKNYGVKTVLSNHDFERTPEKEELIRRLKNMEQLGADIAKIAVMPQSAGDVALVLGATAAASNELSCPIVTMAMGGLGVISRMAGQIFGSAVTFAALGKASAPGQVPLEKLKEVLELVDSLQ
jgi:3-dehydroquinate dehydratase-1